MAMVLAETIDGLSSQKLEIWASDLSLEMLKLAAGAIYTTRDVQGVSPARLQAVLPAGPGTACGLISRRARNSRPGEVPPPRPAEPGLDGPQRFSDHFLPKRVDLFRRRRAADPAQPPGAALAAGRLAGHGQRRDLAGSAAVAAKALAVVVPKRGVRTDGAARSSKDGAATADRRNRSRFWSSTIVPWSGRSSSRSSKPTRDSGWCWRPTRTRRSRCSASRFRA